MKAIQIIKDRLQWVDHEEPAQTENDVIVEVMAAGVNRADLLQRRGLYPPPPGASSILGLECAGRVSGSPWVKDGLYMALVPGGAYAERVSVPWQMLIPLPQGVSVEAAAALPETLYTCYLNLFKLARLGSGETVWITAGSSGIGTMAIQMAKVTGSVVIASAGSVDKVQRCVDLGADGAFNHRTENVVDAVRSLTHGSGVDVILDMVGGDFLEQRMRLLKRNGRLALIGLLGGVTTTLDLNKILGNNLVLLGSTLRDRSLQEKTMLTDDLKTNVLPWVANGRIKPVVDSVLDIDRASDAHDRMLKGMHFGKIVLRIC